MIYKRGKTWYYRFEWRGKEIRKSTKQGNKQVALDMEAAHRTGLAKGEVGIGDKDRPAAVPTLAEFAERDFLPYVRATFAAKPKTIEYYRNGAKSLLAHRPIERKPLDVVNQADITAYIEKRQRDGLLVSSINRELEVLRRMFRLAIEWKKIKTAPTTVHLLPGENCRDQVLSPEEEERYLNSALPLLRQVATILLDCGMRPDEVFRLRWDELRGNSIKVAYGKTLNASRIIPLTPRAVAVIEMRKGQGESPWVFPAPTRSGHIDKSSLRKQHARACKLAQLDKFPLYTLRHTCLTRWAPHMDPYTLAQLAGHSDFQTTKRYIHVQEETARAAMERAHRPVEGRHKSRHSITETVEQQDTAPGEVVQ